MCPTATQMVDLNDFVEMTKKYAQGIVPSVPQNGSQVTVKAEITKPHDSGGEVKKQTKETAKIEIRAHEKKDVILLFLKKFVCICVKAQG